MPERKLKSSYNSSSNPLVDGSKEPVPCWRKVYPGSKPPSSVRVYLGDCVSLMEQMGPAQADLVFCDPPFNIGYEYDSFTDRLSDEDYLMWCEHWIKQCYRLCKPYGSFFLAIGAKYQAQLKVIAERNLWRWRDTIVWHYTFGPHQAKRYTPSWVALHWFSKSDVTYS